MQTHNYFTNAALIAASSVSPYCGDNGAYVARVIETDDVFGTRAECLIGNVGIVRRDRATAKTNCHQLLTSRFTVSDCHVMPVAARVPETASMYGDGNAYMHGECSGHRWRSVTLMAQAIERYLAERFASGNVTPLAAVDLYRTMPRQLADAFDAAGKIAGGVAANWRNANGRKVSDECVWHVLRDIACCTATLLPLADYGRAASVYVVNEAALPLWRAIASGVTATPATTEQATDDKSAAKAPSKPAKARKAKQASAVA